MQDLLARGHYARKQIFSRNRLVAWSHGSRFEHARRLVSPYAGQRLLDYGCGDGTFLAMVSPLFRGALGVDVSPAQIAECRVRFASLDGIAFATTAALERGEHAGRWDVIVCMEVLEHCPRDVQVSVLDRLRVLLAPDGVLVVSVPIETGPALAAKQLARAVAAARGLEEYETRERYGASEFMRMLCAWPDTSIPRAESVARLDDGRAIRFTGHKGFNWRVLERAVRARFAIERRQFTPMPLMGPWLNSQAWFVCRHR